jgi:hypothetical protein
MSSKWVFKKKTGDDRTAERPSGRESESVGERCTLPVRIALSDSYAVSTTPDTLRTSAAGTRPTSLTVALGRRIRARARLEKVPVIPLCRMQSTPRTLVSDLWCVLLEPTRCYPVFTVL